jgi:hypothetical protein
MNQDDQIIHTLSSIASRSLLTPNIAAFAKERERKNDDLSGDDREGKA